MTTSGREITAALGTVLGNVPRWKNNSCSSNHEDELLETDSVDPLSLESGEVNEPAEKRSKLSSQPSSECSVELEYDDEEWNNYMSELSKILPSEP